MARWHRFVTKIGEPRIISGLGALEITMAVLRISVFAGDKSLSAIIGTDLLIILPGVALLYGGYRLPSTDLQPEVYSLIVARTLAGVVAMLGVVGVLAVSTGLNRPVFTPMAGTALGSLAGFLIGINEARARSRAYEAEQARKEAEERSKELERTKEQLEETVEHLETSNERLEQFAYAASHDLQEPLRMVSSYLQLLENRYADDLDADAQEFIDYAVDGADRMRAMIESLLEYSRVTSGGSLEPTDADAVLDEVLTDLRLEIEETDATVTSDDLPTVNADRDQLAQVFRNLVSNALEYSGDHPPRVHVSADRTDDTWRFAVSDEGVGIDPDYHDRIFNVFEQLHPDVDETAGTGGVGLALCERIIERHRGDIWVDSEPGEETTFYFTIPIPTPEETQSASAARSPTQRRPEARRTE